jgi:hypothetical protein
MYALFCAIFPQFDESKSLKPQEVFLETRPAFFETRPAFLKTRPAFSRNLSSFLVKFRKNGKGEIKKSPNEAARN